MRVRLGLAVLSACALSGTVRADDPPPAAPVREIQMTASRFRYEPRVIEAGEGERVVIHVRSLDVQHGFGLEAFGVKTEIPETGEPVTVEFTASKPGTYHFECTEYCGRGHYGMNGRLIVRPTGTPVGTGASSADVFDDEIDPAEPDFTVVNLPTTLRLPRHKMAFIVTHRFGRPLGQGDFGDLLGDFFGLDSGAQIGIGLRYGIRSGTQLAVYRTNDKAIQFLGEQSLLKQGDAMPVSAALVAAVEGRDNFHEEYSPTFGVTVSRRLSDRGALYAVPAWVGNTRLAAGSGDDSTLMVGLGARYRVGGGASVVGEITPRLTGFKPGHALASVAIEERVGGHSFQLNFSNGLATSLAQIARGGPEHRDWFLGFNISRKFY